jgi:hypothetical protein
MAQRKTLLPTLQLVKKSETSTGISSMIKDAFIGLLQVVIWIIAAVVSIACTIIMIGFVVVLLPFYLLFNFLGLFKGAKW